MKHADGRIMSLYRVQSSMQQRATPMLTYDIGLVCLYLFGFRDVFRSCLPATPLEMAPPKSLI
jgi:hypothetical protein